MHAHKFNLNRIAFTQYRGTENAHIICSHKIRDRKGGGGWWLGKERIIIGRKRKQGLIGEKREKLSIVSIFLKMYATA